MDLDPLDEGGQDRTAPIEAQGSVAAEGLGLPPSRSGVLVTLYTTGGEPRPAPMPSTAV